MDRATLPKCGVGHECCNILFLYYDFLPKGLGKLRLAKGIKGKKIRKHDGITKNNNHPSIINV
jgi:hypothetical protein